jgi:hypothetical protein
MCSIPGCPINQPLSWDEDWKQKIEIAREAYELGRKLREGKPTSFRRALG